MVSESDKQYLAVPQSLHAAKCHLYSSSENTRDGRADMTNFEMDLFDTRLMRFREKDEDEWDTCGRHSCVKPACVPVSIIGIFVLLVVFFPIFNEDFWDSAQPWQRTGQCAHDCRFELVESLPENLTFANGSVHSRTTLDAWSSLIGRATRSIDVAAFYWDLRGSDQYPDPTDWQGERVYALLRRAGAAGVKVRIAQSETNSRLSKNLDSAKLAADGLAEVRSLNFSQWFDGGVLHTKLIIVDGAHFYVGSANMDWKSLTQVKELGVWVRECGCLASDLRKVFDVYWRMGEAGARIPRSWPPPLRTKFNADSPLAVSLNGTATLTYFSSSPPGFSPRGRSNDSAAIVRAIASARRFVHIAVMDYAPTTLYLKHNRYWPLIDDALRAAAFERSVEVRILASHWNHTRSSMFAYLRSLAALDGALSTGSIQVKLFEVPSYNVRQAEIPFARVNHNKYMVTDNTAYIGTSNWAGDYFIDTAGVGMVIRDVDSSANDSISRQLNAIFLRDWHSPYAKPLR